MRYLLTSALVTLAALSSTAASAVELTLIAPGGIRAAIQQMIPGYKKQTGNTVKATFGSGGGTHERVVKGEAFDVPVLQPPYQDALSSGHVVAASETPLANVSVGLAVRPGQPKPDISTADAVKKLLLGAKAVSIPNAATGAAAGVSFDETLKKLGIADQMKDKLKVAQGGAGAMAMLAKGEVDYGFTFVSEIITEPGVEAVGPLPRDASTPTFLVAFLGTDSKNADAAKALISYLSGPQAAAVYKERGMVPGK